MRDDSAHDTKVVYYRMDTNKTQTFWFNIGRTDQTILEFNGTHLVCKASAISPQCNSLPKDTPVKALLISVDINPRRGQVLNNQWSRNRYSLEGSYTKVTCEKSKFSNLFLLSIEKLVLL